MEIKLFKNEKLSRRIPKCQRKNVCEIKQYLKNLLSKGKIEFLNKKRSNDNNSGIE